MCICVIQVDVDALDFGLVSYGFRYSVSFTLTNTSGIPMRFDWRMPEDNPDVKLREFQVFRKFLPLNLSQVLVKAENHSFFGQYSPRKCEVNLGSYTFILCVHAFMLSEQVRRL